MQGNVVVLPQAADVGKPQGKVTADDLQQAMRDVFERRVVTNKTGHSGDIVPFDRALGEAMAADYPDEVGLATVSCQQK